MTEKKQPELPAISSIVGFPNDNPRAKLVWDRERARVVERNYYWDPKKGRGLEKRKYLGYVVDCVFYDNSAYRRLFNKKGEKRLVPKKLAESIPAPTALETVQAGEMPLYFAVAQATGLIEDLTITWGKDKANAVLSVAFHWISTANNSAYLFKSWAPGRLLPYREILDGKTLSELFRALAEEPDWRKTFFARRIGRLPEDEVLSFDATEVASEADEISYAQNGRGKEGLYQRQIGLIVLLGHRSRMPALFRVLPGNITDVTTVQDMLFRFEELAGKKRVFAAVLDRGYCSLENIARFIDSGSRVIVAAKTNYSWVQDAIEEVLPNLWSSSARIRGESCWGGTVPVKLDFPDGKTRSFQVHVYRSDSMTDFQTGDFYGALDDFENQWNAASGERANSREALQKSPLLKYFKKGNAPLLAGVDELVRDDEKIDEAIRYLGFFCSVTTFECSAKDALYEYGVRDLIEKCFRTGKSRVQLAKVRAHTDLVAEGRFLVGFCCMTILNDLLRRMHMKTTLSTPGGKEKEIRPLDEEMSLSEIKNYLSPIRLLSDGHGNLRWMEITKRQQSIAERLGFPTLYQNIPSWA